MEGGSLAEEGVGMLDWVTLGAEDWESSESS
jgi:hypothetical protein